ncbi:hypothetical protein DEA8626_02950 [Defluviimonas aquaemixtae]|uniref:DUF2971 domain-containing protein n=1 Tax=Albidovulum aquaemixtae TaxID=1542388 RepID=A0A2R8BKP0_9RHOB|nr:hypothetical protein [Defluviimonas aquaemixtae]SPH23873.1 hypothetical protein DEA8626_02950 [Defluviimonas aquaemixtae]
MPMNRWLKKYTKLEHLEPTFRALQLHLGDPKEWDDKNDSECIRIYSERFPEHEIRGTCLTEASDRFHFWHVFGERENGVCLWFERDSLIDDIKQDGSLLADKVRYRLPAELSQLELRLIPFAKRKQYRDECEFRVLRIHTNPGIDADKFSFSANSLKRIYLNPWLSPKEVKREKDRISGLLKDHLKHVRVMQNRSLKQKAWIDAVSARVGTNH